MRTADLKPGKASLKEGRRVYLSKLDRILRISAGALAAHHFPPPETQQDEFLYKAFIDTAAMTELIPVVGLIGAAKLIKKHRKSLKAEVYKMDGAYLLAGKEIRAAQNSCAKALLNFGQRRASMKSSKKELLKLDRTFAQSWIKYVRTTRALYYELLSHIRTEQTLADRKVMARHGQTYFGLNEEKLTISRKSLPKPKHWKKVSLKKRSR
jgi:hypothetical protein